MRLTKAEMTTAVDRDLEREVVIRWDRASDVAMLYTADKSEMRRWQKLGYDVQVCGRRASRPTGWQVTVPIAAVALLALKDGQLKIPRYLDPPTLWTSAQNAQGVREPGKTDENIQEIRAHFSGAEQTSA